MPFAKNNAKIGKMDVYVMKLTGVEIDLGIWREHVEVDADDNGNGGFEEDMSAAVTPIEEPHLINAYAKFQLTDPSSDQSIEVAYTKDQKGRLIGFDHLSREIMVLKIRMMASMRTNRLPLLPLRMMESVHST